MHIKIGGAKIHISHHISKILIPTLIILIIGGFVGFLEVPKLVNPLDHYFIVSVEPANNTPLYQQTSTRFDSNDTKLLNKYGVSPCPLYIPAGYTLMTAEQIDSQNTGGHAIKVSYICDKSPTSDFYVIVSESDTLNIDFGNFAINDPMKYSGTQNERWATFANTDVVVYQINTTKQCFAHFQAQGHDWFVSFNHMSLHDMRLIMTSIIQNSTEGLS